MTQGASAAQGDAAPATSAVRGAFRDNNVTRAEAMSIIYGRH